MKVLVVGSFIDHDLGGDIVFYNGFKELNIDVVHFDYRDTAARVGIELMRQKLIDVSLGKDLIFIGKGHLLDTHTLKRIRKNKTQVVLWYGDIRVHPEDWLISLLEEVDVFFMSSGGEVLKEHFRRGKPGIAAYYFNPSSPSLVQKFDKGIMTKKYDLTFTGSAYFYPNKERKLLIETLRNDKRAYFVGGAKYYDSQIKLKASKAIGRILGKDKGLKYLRNYPYLVKGNEYYDLMQTSRLGVGVSAFQDVDKYTSDRLTHFIEFGTPFIAWSFPKVEELFKIGEELICFGNIEDFNNKINYYLRNYDELEEIGKNAQKRILNDYNSKEILKMMLEICSTGTSSKYEWIEVYK